MQVKLLGKTFGDQDGAIFNHFLFHFDARGNGYVYDVRRLSDDPAPISQFRLDRADHLVPHSNSVMFGNARYQPDDEFPLLYTNVYNNYAKSDKPMKGVTCVYRLVRNGNIFSTTLLQLIEIAFTEDPIWKSVHINDVRPYGNFAIDCKNSTYYAFVMRDEDQTTRYFSFDLPPVKAGTYDESLGAWHALLKKEDIKTYFDCEYHRFIQGACLHDGILYSLEGFTNDEKNPPVIRLIDVKQKRQIQAYHLMEHGMTIEPELIDFNQETCYYADTAGNTYELIF